MAESRARKNRIVGHANVDPHKLMAHPQNWRLHPEHQQAVLRGSLDELGWIKSIQVQQGTELIVDGHARVMIAIRDGEPEVPVEYVDLTDAEVRAALATVDPIAALADQDYKMLSDLLSGVSAQEPGFITLTDELEAQANDALAMAAQYVGREKTNFDSVSSVIAKRKKTALKVVFSIAQAEEFESALEATGKLNRADAVMELVQHYLKSRKTAGENRDNNQATQLDRDGEDRASQALAEAAERERPARARNARRPR